jgi:hypothetical protein
LVTDVLKVPAKKDRLGAHGIEKSLHAAPWLAYAAYPCTPRIRDLVLVCCLLLTWRDAVDTAADDRGCVEHANFSLPAPLDQPNME